MKKLAAVLSAILLLGMLVSAAQGAMPASGNTRPTAPKGVNISGTVSTDGKTFLAEDDNRWTVSNVEALRGHEGHYVTIRCRMDPNRRTIHVFSVEQRQTEKARLGDSAFRR